VSGLPLKFSEESRASNFPESPGISIKPFPSGPEEVLRATALFLKEDVDHQNFISSGSVNAGTLRVLIK
jgi:hypothetical protein